MAAEATLATDATETQEVDIMAAPSPAVTPPPIPSPPATAAEKRAKYTGARDSGLPSTANDMDRSEEPSDGSAAPGAAASKQERWSSKEWDSDVILFQIGAIDLRPLFDELNHRAELTSSLLGDTIGARRCQGPAQGVGGSNPGRAAEEETGE